MKDVTVRETLRKETFSGLIGLGCYCRRKAPEGDLQMKVQLCRCEVSSNKAGIILRESQKEAISIMRTHSQFNPCRISTLRKNVHADLV